MTGSGDYYTTSSPVNLNSAIKLNIAAMNSINQVSDANGGLKHHPKPGARRRRAFLRRGLPP
ncbi:MAG: hypothetical protein LBB83_08185 [Treponema sp.]|jgi:hypothetical protein|nr:hypothetical protein [Treponema sp.]